MGGMYGRWRNGGEENGMDVGRIGDWIGELSCVRIFEKRMWITGIVSYTHLARGRHERGLIDGIALASSLMDRRIEETIVIMPVLLH